VATLEPDTRLVEYSIGMAKDLGNGPKRTQTCKDVGAGCAGWLAALRSAIDATAPANHRRTLGQQGR